LIVVALFFGIGEIGFRLFGSSHERTISGVGIAIYQPSATDVWEHKPGAFDKNGYGDPPPEISIDSIGLRDWEFKPEMAQGKNILMLGDSFTFGTGLWAKDTFPKLLEQQIRAKYGTDWRVWNAGVVGTTIDDYYMNLKKYYPILKPKIVVVNTFVGNDVTELGRHEWKKDWGGDLVRVTDDEIAVAHTGQLATAGKPVPVSLFWDFLQERFSILFSKFSRPSEKYTLTWPVFLAPGHPGYDPRIPDLWERYFEAFDDLRRFCENNHVSLLVNVIPMDVQVSKSYWSKYSPLIFDDTSFQADLPQQQILGYCSKNQVDCLDPLSQFRENARKDILYFSALTDPHFDKSGHQLMSDLLFDRLTPVINKYDAPSQ
jgi:GDSL-like Lipase/Acylhydrolase family